jgi:hypothetical protein
MIAAKFPHYVDKMAIGLVGPGSECFEEEWLAIPEQSLAICTNGRVFHDPSAAFSRWRGALQRFYPTDVRLNLQCLKTSSNSFIDALN